MTRLIGLHLRCNEHLKNLIDKSMRLNLNIFQCFLRRQDGSLLQPNREEHLQFMIFKQQVQQLYAHASYKINLADPNQHRHPALQHEIKLAFQLGFTHMIMHPGSAQNAQQGIAAVVKQLNFLTEHVPDLTFVLENVAFGPPSIGGNIDHLVQILEKLQRPESVGICIDTAHAYAFGYNIADETGLMQFFDTLTTTGIINKINLIHINDTQTTLGSRHDVHCPLGQGNIGLTRLKQFALYNKLSQIPLICELPLLDEHHEQAALDTIKKWHLT